jgi:hypothetical protein
MNSPSSEKAAMMLSNWRSISVAVEPEQRGVQVDVLPAGQVGVEARAQFQQRADAAAHLDGARGRLHRPGDEAEDGGLARAVAADERHRLARPDRVQRHVAQRPEVLVLAARAGDALEDLVEQVGLLLVQDVASCPRRPGG